MVECINMHYCKTGAFGVKNKVNGFYKTVSSSRFSQSSISHHESPQLYFMSF